MSADYHVHIENGPCTIEWLKEFINSGLSKGLKEIGISEHGHRFIEGYNVYKSDGFRTEWVKGYMDQSIEEYVELIKKAKALGLPVKLGIEADYFPDKEKELEMFLKPYPWDYVIGSVHWLGDWGIDLEESIEEWKSRNTDEVYIEYFDIIEKMAKTGLFDVIGHIDLVKIFGFRPRPKTFDKIRKNIEEISKTGIVIEVSTAGFRKPVGEIYPSKEIMEMIREYNIPVIINSDAHYPEHVAFEFDKAYEYVKSFGINTLYYFNKRNKTPYQI
ncbi:MAG TPA: histidinol-phosphatase [Clostridia bacterium]|nr:histidinol-phosphatase [Clostridia bacterium]